MFQHFFQSLLITLVASVSTNYTMKIKKIEKNQMTVQWYHHGDSIYFELSAPTNGWIGIGFNSSHELKGNYLILGSITDQKKQVVEHYILNPGNYKTITQLGGQNEVYRISGSEKKNKTTLKFSLPIEPSGPFKKSLAQGLKYSLLMAYSLSDDFDHHSIMRTSISIEL